MRTKGQKREKKEKEKEQATIKRWVRGEEEEEEEEDEDSLGGGGGEGEEEEEWGGGRITELAHRAGVNVRFLGLVFFLFFIYFLFIFIFFSFFSFFLLTTPIIRFDIIVYKMEIKLLLHLFCMKCVRE